MKIVCAECGAENDLGRVFCTSCGKKLDLKAVSREEIAVASKGSPVKAIIKIVVLVLVLAILAGVGVALWPLGPASDEVAKRGASHVQRELRRLSMSLRSRNRVSKATVSEGQLNDYLTSESDGAVSCRVLPGRIVVRYLGVYDHGLGFLPPLKYSYEVKLAPLPGFLKVAGARVGHLPAVGPLKGMAVGKITGVFPEKTQEDVAAIVAKSTDIAADPEAGVKVTVSTR